jgi:hypothetical protein
MGALSGKWLLLLPVAVVALAHVDRQQNLSPGNWRQASQESVGLAPDPAVTPEAVVQVYAARAVRWRGYFGVHTWIATKQSNAEDYTIYEVLGWRLRRGGNAVVVRNRLPDARWFGNAPELLAELRGEGVDDIIARVDSAAEAYPYAGTYRVWPGPNSNTFTAFVLRDVPELRVDLPPNAIGKDYLGTMLVARTPSGTGGQFNLFGLLGILAGVEEGVELNLLGLTFGIDPKDFAFKVPMAGSLNLFGSADSTSHSHAAATEQDIE